METRRKLDLIVMVVTQIAMFVCHFIYIVYFVIMGLFSWLLLIAAVGTNPYMLVPLILLVTYPVTAIASAIIAWRMFAKNERLFALFAISCVPVVHLIFTALSYGLMIV